MSHSNRGPLATYNSLTDRHLAGFFANSRVREHLRRSGLITADGEIINDATYRLNMARKDHKKHVKDLLAQAIVHKTLDIERLRQIEVKRRLEEIAKLETVRRIKQYREKKGDDNLLPLLSPTRQLSARSLHSSLRSRPSGGSQQPRPSSAPDGQDNVQGAENRQGDNLDELPVDALRDYAISMNFEQQKRKDYNPYRVPQIPLPPKKERVNRQTAKAQRLRQQEIERNMKMEERPAYAGMEYKKPLPPQVHMPALQSYCTVNMRYHGYGLNLVRQEIDRRQEIMVDQQHCGGNTRTVFKELLAPGAQFKFSSLRHQGYPFSLTLYIDGKVDCRVSTCCEFGHKAGGKLGHFSFVNIEGTSAKPCYKCQMGLKRPISHRRLPYNPRTQGETVTVVSAKPGSAPQPRPPSRREPQSQSQQLAPPASAENVVVAVEKEEDEGEAAAKSPGEEEEEEAQNEAVGYADDFEEDETKKEGEVEDERPRRVEGLEDELADRQQALVRARSSSSSSSSSSSRSAYSSSFEEDSGSEAGGDRPKSPPPVQDADRRALLRDDEDEDKGDDKSKDGDADDDDNDDDLKTPRVTGIASDDDEEGDHHDSRGSPGRRF